MKSSHKLKSAAGKYKPLSTLRIQWPNVDKAEQLQCLPLYAAELQDDKILLVFSVFAILKL